MIKKILVAKLRHHGDVLLSSPVFTKLKKSYPEAKIYAYIYKETLPMLEGSPAIDEFILYDKKRTRSGKLKKIVYELSLLRKIKKEKFDLVINLTEGDRGAIAALASKAQYKVGFDPQNSGFFGKRKVYTHVTRICPGFRHSVERNLDVLRSFGETIEEDDKELQFFVNFETKEKVKNLLKLIDIDPDNFVVVHPVSRWLFKCWDEKKMAESVDFLVKKGFNVVLTGSPDPEEKKINEKVMSLLRDTKGVYDLSGKITLKELGALIAFAKLILTVDSVPMHIASALNTPTVALFGPTSEKNWAPWKNPYALVVKDDSYPCRPCFMPGCGGSGISECIKNLGFNQVKVALEKAIAFQNPLAMVSEEANNLQR